MLDFETSGFESGNIPAQLAYQILDDHGQLVAQHSCFLVGPTQLDRWVLDNAPHITLEKCAAGERLPCALATMFDAAGPQRCVVAHNARFDMQLLVAHGGDRTVTDLSDSRRFCSMASTALFCTYVGWDGRCKYPKLQELARRLRIKLTDVVAHDAIGDVELTSRCLLELAKPENDSLYSFSSPPHNELLAFA